MLRNRHIPTVPVRKSICVSVTPELERFVAAQLASGRYQTASEVFRAGLRLLERDEAALRPPTEPATPGQGRRAATPERA
jgi:antitoxin ParD1/3/4